MESDSTELETLRRENEALRRENEELRKRVAEVEQASAESIPYAQIFEYIPVALHVRHANGFAIAGNLHHRMLTGIESARKTGVKHDIHKDEQDVDRGITAAFKRATQGEVVKLPPTFYDLSKTGIPGARAAQIWVESTFFPVDDAAGTRYVVGMHRDITEHRQAEEANRRLQDEMLRVKEAALRALSTPLIPIAAGVLAMPLIGDIDPSRAHHILETLLHGVANKRASVAILDATGVTSAGPEVADALVQAAKAVGLLGAQVILTGIQPALAQALTSLDVTLSNVVTRSTLEDGIAFAMRMRR